MKLIRYTLIAGLLSMATLASSASSLGAGLSSFNEDFESSNLSDSFLGNGWIFFNTVVNGDLFLFNYSGPAPNGPQISALVNDQGGVEQGQNQLSIYSDYECCQPNTGHNSTTGIGAVITNVFQEQLVGAENVGEVWTFSFDAKLGNIEGNSQAFAFLRILDPSSGFSTSQEATIETTLIGIDWARYSMSVTLGDVAGQLLQFGFSTRSSNFDGSGIFYDNIEFAPAPVPVPAAIWLLGSALLGLATRSLQRA